MSANRKLTQEVRSLVKEGKYQEAYEQIQGIEYSRLKQPVDISVVAEILEAVGQYEEAMTLLVKLYTKSKTRRVLYQLTVVCVKRKRAIEAEKYFKEYITLAPKDPDQHLLRFLIDKLEKKSYEEQIASLEAFKEYSYSEEWAYELAKLYHKAGLKEKCLKECSDIVLWFGEGVIVRKAELLKELYTGKPERINAVLSEVQRISETMDLSRIGEEIAAIRNQETVRQKEKSNPESKVVRMFPKGTKEKTPHKQEVFSKKLPEEEKEEIPVTSLENHLPEETNQVVQVEPRIFSDPWLTMAISILEEDDYIITEQIIQITQELVEAIKKECPQEEWKKNITKKMKCVIDRAEKRNMKILQTVVSEGSYGSASLLTLKAEDFL